MPVLVLWVYNYEKQCYRIMRKCLSVYQAFLKADTKLPQPCTFQQTPVDAHEC
ncbi:hypothetical protein AG1IA_06976 [Rhizoctonia solani AG-1 IA]|uniref:Uncharacterized protein n=1 Tax=Thanatephorus cucumeris (strain AG1-IA) TaxID=983506 RepID=L8WLF4_THACA|nr:hypothetical protein AG1IA_06976 [Rhizoctonia solani AG-1 IA]